MFVQKTTSRRDNKIYNCYLVRQSFRTEKGPRSRTIANITGLPEEVREVIAQMLKGKQVVAVDDLALARALDYGGIAIVHDAWKRYGMDRLFLDVPSVRYRSLLKALVFARLLFPSSKLALRDKARGTVLSAACGLDLDETFDEDDLYAAMDELSGRWVHLEKQLFQENTSRVLSLVLYDLTSVYFEGRGPEHLARYGYSRDHRGDRRQVLLAVATDADGVPLHLEVLKGNRGDTTTLKGLLETLKRRFGIDEVESVVFSFDGAMASRVNLQAMEAERLRYVTRLSKSQLGSLMKQLPEDREPELFDHTLLFEIEHEGKRYVIAGGSMRRERDRLRREVRIEKAEKELEALSLVKRGKVDPQKLSSQLGRMLQRKKAHKYFHYHVDDHGKIHYERKQEVIEAEARLDGWYLLKTNLPVEDADTAEVLSHYKS